MLCSDTLQSVDFDRALSQQHKKDTSKARESADIQQEADDRLRSALRHFEDRVPPLLEWLTQNGARPGRIAYGHAKLPRHSPNGVVLGFHHVGAGYHVLSHKSGPPRRPKSVTVLLTNGQLYYGSKGWSGDSGIRKQGDAYGPNSIDLYPSDWPDLQNSYWGSRGSTDDERWDSWFEETALKVLQNHRDLGIS